MKKTIIALVIAAFSLTLPSLAFASQKAKNAKATDETSTKEVYTGTLVNMSGRMVTTGFSLTLEARTSDEEAQRLLQVLASKGQDGLMDAIRKNNLGYIAATGQTRRNLLVVREAEVNGQRRVIAAFERWVGFFEARGGYRSLDHPFAIIEIFFDKKGKGSGTFIGLAQVKLVTDKKTEQLRLELESFGSFPAKVMGVIRRGK